MPKVEAVVKATQIKVHDWDRMATLKLDPLAFPDAPENPYDPFSRIIKSEDRIRQIKYNIDRARKSFDGTPFDGTDNADKTPGEPGCFKPIHDGAQLITCGNEDAMGFLSPDGWFYPASQGHSDCSQRLASALMLSVNIYKGGAESAIMDDGNWVKFAVYGHDTLNGSDIYSYGEKHKKLTRKQQDFLLAAIKAGRAAGWSVQDKFEARVLEGDISR